MKKTVFFVLLLSIILLTVPTTATAMAATIQAPSSTPLQYAAGWEVRSSVYGIKVTHPDLPSDIRRKVWTYADRDKFTECISVGLGMWEGVDVDGEPYALCPDIVIEIDQAPIHVDKAGEKSPDDEPVETVEKRVGGRYYVYDVHLFQLGINVHTLADVDGPYWTWYGQSLWQHEISSRFGEVLADPDLPGLPWEGSVYIRFTVDPWPYRIELIGENITIDGETYTLLYDEDKPVIAAVMLVEVFDINKQAVYELEGNTYTDVQQLVEKGYKYKASYGVQAYPSERSDLNMFLPEQLSSYAGSESPEMLSPDEVERLKTDIVFEIPLRLIVGAYVGTAWSGAYNEIIPVNPLIHFTIHVEVLTVHNFVLKTSPTAEEVHAQQEEMNYTAAGKPFWEWPAEFFKKVGDYFRENPARLWVFGFGLLVFGALLITFFSVAMFVI